MNDIHGCTLLWIFYMIYDDSFLTYMLVLLMYMFMNECDICMYFVCYEWDQKCMQTTLYEPKKELK